MIFSGSPVAVPPITVIMNGNGITVVMSVTTVMSTKPPFSFTVYVDWANLNVKSVTGIEREECEG